MHYDGDDDDHGGDDSNTHCISVCIRSYSGQDFPAFWLNTERYGVSSYSVQMRENVDQNNSECGHFTQWVKNTNKNTVL